MAPGIAFNRVARDLGRRRIRLHDGGLQPHRRHAACATPASICRSQGDPGLFAPGQAAARAWASELPRLLRAGRRQRRRRAAEDAGGADHQRHALLPRAAPLRPPARPGAAAAARGRAPGRRGAHLVGGLLERPGALFDRADDPVADAGRGRATTSGSWPPTSTPTSSPKATRGRLRARRAARRAGRA